MTHTNEFLRGMFAAYMGCEVQYKSFSSCFVGTPFTIGTIGLWVSIKDLTCTEYVLYKESNPKPILTPLSEITDEDAVEVAKIMKIPQFERAKLFGCDENNYYTIGRHIKNEIIETCYDDGFYLQGSITDYLRSKQYDCGYMHIPSLIAADLAISSKQI